MEQLIKKNQFYMDFREELKDMLPVAMQELRTEWAHREEEIKRDFLNCLIVLSENKTAEKAYLIISPLYASFLMEQYECMLAIYDESLYLDQNASYAYLALRFIGDIVGRGIDAFLQEKNEIVFEEYKKAELRYQYACLLMDSLRVLFSELLVKAKEEAPMLMKDICVCFGFYMEKAEIIGEMQ